MAFEATLAAADRRWDGRGGGCEALGGGEGWVVLMFFRRCAGASRSKPQQAAASRILPCCEICKAPRISSSRLLLP
jgi:hypothetical protein